MKVSKEVEYLLEEARSEELYEKIFMYSQGVADRIGDEKKVLAEEVSHILWTYTSEFERNYMKLERALTSMEEDVPNAQYRWAERVIDEVDRLKAVHQKLKREGYVGWWD